MQTTEQRSSSATIEVEDLDLGGLDLSGDFDIDAELAKFEAAERAKLGLDEQKEHWNDPVPSDFSAKQHQAANSQDTYIGAYLARGRSQWHRTCMTRPPRMGDPALGHVGRGLRY